MKMLALGYYILALLALAMAQGNTTSAATNGTTTTSDNHYETYHPNNDDNDNVNHQNYHHTQWRLRSQSFFAVFCCAIVALHALLLTCKTRLQ
ncbi:hypothetical protein PFLUV_G00158030 [Perca fluviatilis]|uniref:Uncharacterized protein n=1 Tax=Perca fluviatilis TaxID=8168 RepID=A0A6A5EST9_PERFL|nr:hypothetical protein PFLUV_G00158030 [Perca fluviatilis]